MSNPLVAERKDSTKSFTGIAIAESVDDTRKAIESGDWAGGVLGVVGTSLDALGAAMDPFGAALAAGVGWLIEHVGPLSEALDDLTGDPDEIKAHSETWKNISTELEDLKTELADLIKADTAAWTGEAADAYRKRGEDTGNLIAAAASAASGASDGMGTAGEVVGTVRTLVRDIIADLMGHMISWALQVIATLGIGLAWVVPQVVTAVAKTAAKIADITQKLVQAMQKLTPLLKKLGDGFDDAAKSLKDIKADGGKSDAPKPEPGPKDKSNLDPPPKDKGDPDPPPNDKGSPPPAQTNSTSADPGPTPGGDRGNPDPPPKSSGPDNSGGPSSSGPASAGPSNSKNNPNTSNSNKPANPVDSKTPADGICTGGSEPVDMATGHMVMTEVDLEILGPLSLVVERMYVSSYRAGRWFGSSWTSTLDQRLEVDDENVCYFSPDGMILVYPLPSAGSPVLPVEGPRWPLRIREDGGYSLDAPDRKQTMQFAPLVTSGRHMPLMAVQADDGRRIDIEHHRFGPPKVIRHSDGYRVEIDSARERVTGIRVVDPQQGADVPVMQYGYDDQGRLAAVINSSGKALRFQYDSAGRLTEWQDRNGFWFRYVYDEHGRVVRTVGDKGYFDSEFSYSNDGRRSITRYTDSLGGVKEFEFNAAKQLVREVDALGNTTLSSWDRYDRLLSRTDPLGRTTHYEYDPAGHPWRITRPDGSVVELDLDTDGTVASITATDGENTWSRVYDDEKPDPFGGKVGAAPDLDVDDLRSDRGTGTSEPRSAQPDRPLLDLFGRPRETAAPDGSRIQLGWTVDGHRSWRVDSLGAREQWRYDPEGNQIARIDPMGGVTAAEYGPFETELAGVDENGARTERTFDTERRLTSVTNPQGQTWRYVHDLAGRVVEEADFDGRVLGYVYDAAGQLVRSVNGAGEATDYVFDLLGNLVEWRTPSSVTTYTYSPVGHLVRATNDDAVLELELDEHGRITAETVNQRTVAFDYDDTNKVVRRRTPSGVDSAWACDGTSRPIALSMGGHTLRYTTGEAGRVARTQIDDAATAQENYDSEHRLVSQTVTGHSGQSVLARSFRYRPDGELIGTDDRLSGSIRYQIDRTGRVVEVISPDRRENYQYDGLGNILNAGGVPDAAAGPRRYAGNRLVAAGAVQFEYDAQGRLVQRIEAGRNWRYAWDSYDQLVAVTTPEGVLWRYRYDPIGRRIAKQRIAADGAVAEQVDFVWDGGTLIEQVHTDAQGRRAVTTWEHRPDDDTPVAQHEIGVDGSRRFFAIVTDPVGTPTDLIAPNGMLAWHGRTSLWGKELPVQPNGVTTPLRFPGQYADAETGLNYNVHRYYDPATGRYLSQDPLGLAPAPNPVAYVDNPHSAADPLGLAKGGTKRKHDGSGNQPPTTGNGNKKTKTAGDPWDRKPFSHDTEKKTQADKKSTPPGTGYNSAKNDQRHIISFQTMRDNLRSWVDHHYPPGHPQRDEMTKKYTEKLEGMNSKFENLPLGNGPVNTSIGSVVDKWPVVEKRIDGEFIPSKKDTPEPPKAPSAAFEQSAGYAKDLRQEIPNEIMKAADDIKDPVQRKAFLDDVRDSADFDWPGGDKKGEEYDKWMGVRHEINHMGRNPGDTPPGKVDELIDKYHELDRPSGRHDTIEEFRDRPGKPDGNPKWPAGPDATKWPGQQDWKWPGEDGWKPGK
ncbi:sugar-binding protein [Saccharopolyspora erythraea]|uniref:DUF6531 domain-containing protein n=1 Tax=Saccharopolyspora erythraea TaxID=1836 RepID=UPI001BA9CC49|nr:DUF6531 domain-containing protein [Saccharopolyspora erythraea]QUH03850.1 sugar-binding protein [Saccharopolyspora erythraea]